MNGTGRLGCHLKAWRAPRRKANGLAGPKCRHRKSKSDGPERPAAKGGSLANFGLVSALSAVSRRNHALRSSGVPGRTDWSCRSAVRSASTARNFTILTIVNCRSTNYETAAVVQALYKMIFIFLIWRARKQA